MYTYLFTRGKARRRREIFAILEGANVGFARGKARRRRENFAILEGTNAGFTREKRAVAPPPSPRGGVGEGVHQYGVKNFKTPQPENPPLVKSQIGDKGGGGSARDSSDH